MSLTIARLDELLQWSRDHDCPMGIEVALDYARERAARERCEAALVEHWCIDLTGHPGECRAEAWNYEGGASQGCIKGVWCPTPTAAYLALAEELEKR